MNGFKTVSGFAVVMMERPLPCAPGGDGKTAWRYRLGVSFDILQVNNYIIVREHYYKVYSASSLALVCLRWSACQVLLDSGGKGGFLALFHGEYPVTPRRYIPLHLIGCFVTPWCIINHTVMNA